MTAYSLSLPTMKLFILALVAWSSACAATEAPPPATTTPPPSAPVPVASAVATPEASDGPHDDLLGKAAPDFTAVAEDGTSVHLAALRGKWVVVYFYPKDETPGCTKEACSFRDVWKDIAKTGAVLVGISADGSESHRAFAEHYKLPFLLLTDPAGSIGRSYGVPFEGRHRRQTIVVGADGTVRRVYRKVDITVHAAQILDDLRHPEHAG
jgi:thioredoxin-dependent peroxiredoxin